MKTFTLRTLWIPLLALLMIQSVGLQAQTQPKREDGNIRITVRKSVNGDVTYLEANRYVRNEDEVNQILSEYGVDSRVDEMKPGEEIEIVLRKQKTVEAEPEKEIGRPMLGVLYSVETITLGRVDRVFPGTGAANAGMKVGDVIVGIDGSMIHNGDQIREIIASHKPGDVVRIEYMREGRRRETLATLGLWQDIPQEQRIPSLSPNWEYRYPNSGNFNPSLPGTGYLGVTAIKGSATSEKPNYILTVGKDTPAEKAGIRSGDRLISVNGEEVTYENPSTKLIPSHKAGETVHLVIKRNFVEEPIEMDVVLADRMDFVHQAYPEWKVNEDVVRPQPEYNQQAWMGVQLWPGNCDKGAQVMVIFDDSPAEAVGLRRDDIILSIAGEKIACASSLVDVVRKHSAGEVVEVVWIRNGKEMKGACALSARSTDYNAVTEWEEIRITIRKDELSQEEVEALTEKTGEDFSAQATLETETFEVYPNPSEGNFSLNIKLTEAGSLNIRVYDLSGKTVWKQNLESADGVFGVDVDLTNEPAGSYYLLAERNGKSYVKKLIVQ